MGSLSGSSSDSEEGSDDIEISAGPVWWMNLQACPLLHLPFRKNLHVVWILVGLTGRAFVYDAMACCSLSLFSTSLAMSFIILWTFMAWLAGPLIRNVRLSSSVSMVLISTLHKVLIFRMRSPPFPINLAATCLVVVSSLVMSLVWVSGLSLSFLIVIWKFSSGGPVVTLVRASVMDYFRRFIGNVEPVSFHLSSVERNFVCSCCGFSVSL